ncbi:pyocin knob domain-containing protein, partial [Acinetobacter soli]|uniref:pyocin knob domain-containing protein n=1 Tax=Acinetobacter soli TaxID=487316 RepID=UPI00281387F7
MPTKFSFGEIPQDAIVLKGTEDLNAIKAPGYYIFSVAASKTLVNCTVLNASGSIEIVREGDATQISQVVTRCSET